MYRIEKQKEEKLNIILELDFDIKESELKKLKEILKFPTLNLVLMDYETNNPYFYNNVGIRGAIPINAVLYDYEDLLCTEE